MVINDLCLSILCIRMWDSNARLRMHIQPRYCGNFKQKQYNKIVVFCVNRFCYSMHFVWIKIAARIEMCLLAFVWKAIAVRIGMLPQAFLYGFLQRFVCENWLCLHAIWKQKLDVTIDRIENRIVFEWNVYGTKYNYIRIEIAVRIDFENRIVVCMPFVWKKKSVYDSF